MENFKELNDLLSKKQKIERSINGVTNYYYYDGCRIYFGKNDYNSSVNFDEIEREILGKEKMKELLVNIRAYIVMELSKKLKDTESEIDKFTIIKQ